MILISSKVIGVDIVLNDSYCDYKKDTDEVIIDLDRLKEIMEDMYTYGELGCKQFDHIEYGTDGQKPHWIVMGDRYIKCSECGHITKTESPDIYNFCMVCGAKMIESEDTDV